MVRRYFVPTRLLESGIRIDQSIIDGTGRVLIARGALLDEYLIDSLQKLGISGVYIREGEEDIDKSLLMAENEPVAPATLEKIEKLKVADRTKVQLSNGERARVVENFEEAILRPKVVGLKTGRVYDLARDLSCANIIVQ